MRKIFYTYHSYFSCLVLIFSISVVLYILFREQPHTENQEQELKINVPVGSRIDY